MAENFRTDLGPAGRAALKKEPEAGLANGWESGQLWPNSSLFRRARLGMKPEQSIIIGLTLSALPTATLFHPNLLVRIYRLAEVNL